MESASCRACSSIIATGPALTIYVSKREIGSARSESIMVIRGAALAIVRDDVTGAGIGNDWLLIGAGIAWIGTLILTDSPLPRDEIEAAWATVGKQLDYLGRLIESTRPGRAEPLPAPPRISDLPGGPPANDKLPPILGHKPRPSSPLSPSPVPLPRPKKDDDGDRDKCKPRPVPHRSGDSHHNWCADVILHNQFPTKDLLVNGKRFDSLAPGNMLSVMATSTAWSRRPCRGWLQSTHQARVALWTYASICRSTRIMWPMCQGLPKR